MHSSTNGVICNARKSGANVPLIRNSNGAIGINGTGPGLVLN